MPDLVAFLLARIAEDEALAQGATKDPLGETYPGDPGDGVWTSYDHPAGRYDTDQRSFRLVGTEVKGTMVGWTICETGREGHAVAVSDHIARHDPARVLAEIEAKRAIIGRCRNAARGLAEITRDGHVPPARISERDLLSTNVAALLMCVKLLAAPYADHPDFDPAWRTG